ncbi:MAG: DUF1761 domain-containing protein [Saprospiraceae bacterium]|nr:DUF1761 domain-containing protein [Saprospiraceae bacterium]
MEMNWIAILVAALVPTVVGFIWYNPKTVGTAWMKAADMTEEKMQGANMGVIFGVSFVLSVMLAMSLMPAVIHQMHIESLFMDAPGLDDPASEISQLKASVYESLGTAYRSWGHGALHGAILSIFTILPVMGTNALFERKGFKYIAINMGYWIITISIMGAIICGWQ